MVEDLSNALKDWAMALERTVNNGNAEEVVELRNQMEVLTTRCDMWICKLQQISDSIEESVPFKSVR